MFASRLNQIMKDQHITQQSLANALGVTRQAISQYIGGKTQPSAEIVASIASFLCVSSDYLLGLTDIKSPDPNTRIFCKETGLSEEAVCLLKHIQNVSVWDEEEEDKAYYMENKDSLFQVVNCLLSYHVIDFLMSYSICVKDCCENTDISEKLARWKALSSDEFSIDPVTYREFAFYQMADHAKRLSDMVYRKIYYGDLLTKDGIYLRSPEEFEIIVRDEYKRTVETNKKFLKEYKEE